MKSFAYEYSFGAHIVSPGRASFRLWAPALESVILELDGHSAQAMSPRENGWFELECDAEARVRYRYRISTDRVVPDPASRLQSADVHDWSVLIDPDEYLWQQSHWRGRPWREIIIYELHVGCCGGFTGVEHQLQKIAQLGITAIEFMPIADFSGNRNWGYDGVLPFAPDTAYGTPAQLKQLIDSAHAHGLCVYLDVVYNHFGPDGNYLHFFAPDFFRSSSRHTSNPWGDEIDFFQPMVREFFIQNALYWLHEYRFDGLRLDAVHAISDPSWLDEMAACVRRSIGNDRHVHLMLENERNRASHLARNFDAQWNDDWHNVMHVLLTGEREGYYANYIEKPADKLARSLAEGFIYQGEPSPTHDNRPRGEPSAALPPTAFINFLQNHDQIGNRAFGERLNVLSDKRDLRAAIALQLLMPTIPLLFMGEPWQVTTPFLYFTDFHNELADAVREGRSRELAAFDAFKDAVQRSRIPDPNALDTFIASIPSDIENAKEVTRHLAALAFYRELLQLRHRHIIPRLEECKSLGTNAIGEAAVIAGWHFGDGAQLHIAVNFSDVVLSISLIAPLLFASTTTAANLAEKNLLAPHCTVVLLHQPEAPLDKPEVLLHQSEAIQER